VVECGPQVPLVSKPASFACRAERLARTGSGPHRTVLWPSGELERKAPSTDACEEVALGESCEFAWHNVLDGSLVHNSIWDVSALDEFSQPRCGFGIVFIVVVHGLRLPPFALGSLDDALDALDFVCQSTADEPLAVGHIPVLAIAPVAGIRHVNLLEWLWVFHCA